MEKYKNKKTHNALREEGYIIDRTCYPNVAYKGPRFQPLEWFPVQTKREEYLEQILRDVSGWEEEEVGDYDTCVCNQGL